MRSRPGGISGIGVPFFLRVCSLFPAFTVCKNIPTEFEKTNHRSFITLSSRIPRVTENPCLLLAGSSLVIQSAAHLFWFWCVKTRSAFIPSAAARQTQRGGAAADLRGPARPAWGFTPTIHLEEVRRAMHKKLARGRYD